MSFIISRNKSQEVELTLEIAGRGRVQVIGVDRNGKRRVLITFENDGTFSRNHFADIEGVNSSAGKTAQILEKVL